MEALILGLFAAAAAAYSWRQTTQAWRDVAEEVGLAYTNPALGGKKLYGRLRGLEVLIEEVSDNNQGRKILAKVRYVNPTFTLGRDSALKRMIKPDIETGDQLFDERVRIEGDPDWALALLGPDARRLTEILVTGWAGTLKGSTLSASCKNIKEAPSMLATLLDLAQWLQQPPETELSKLLVERACHDPSNAVRFQALRRLSFTPAFREDALAAAETLIDSQQPFLKLEACRLLMDSNSKQSRRAVEDLASLAAWPHAESSVRRSALDALIVSPQHQALALSAMRKILQGPDAPPVRTAALDGLIRSGAKNDLLELQVHNEAEAEILARGLGNFDASAQPRLLELLNDAGDRVRAAAVSSLGQVGDIQAVGALRQIAGQDRLFKSALAREAEKAIESIKSRSGGSQQGEVSITTVAPLEGAVSPADDTEPGGEVSVTS